MLSNKKKFHASGGTSAKKLVLRRMMQKKYFQILMAFLATVSLSQMMKSEGERLLKLMC